MNRKISLGGALTLAIMISTVTFISTMIYAQKTFDGRVFNIKEREVMYSKLAEVDRLVRQNYIRIIDENNLRNGLVNGYLSGIGDPYARYLTDDEMEQLSDNREGRLVGIGVVTSPSPSGFIFIETVYPDSPALAAGLQAGDLIVKVDDLDVTEANYLSAVEGLSGEPGSGVAVTMRRAGLESVLTVTRRRVDVPTVFHRLIGNVGYIRISEFADVTASQFDRALAELSASGALAFVLDVRNNPGGTIESAARILDGLLPAGPIVSATYRDGTTEVLHTSDELFLDVPLVILHNAKSASAAELFAQALKDYGRATSVGVITKGKGTMQSIYSMADGSALDLTVAFYNPPVSPNFEGVGVKPDFEVRLTTDQDANFQNLDETSDPQLKKALEVLLAKLRDIYGILPAQPDVVVVDPATPSLPEIQPSETPPVGNEDDVVSVGPLQAP